MNNYLFISDAAKEVKVESHVLRYWEEELHLPIKRNELGHRYYTEEDVERFKQIKGMKERGLQLKAIKMILRDGKLDVLPAEDVGMGSGGTRNQSRIYTENSEEEEPGAAWKMPEAGMEGAEMAGTGMPDAGGPDAGMPGGGISGAGMSSAGVSGAGMPGAGVSGAGMSGAGVSGAGMSGAGVPGAGMSGAGVSGAGMPGAGVSGAGMPGVGMPGAGVSNAGMPGAGMSDSRMQMTQDNEVQEAFPRRGYQGTAQGRAIQERMAAQERMAQRRAAPERMAQGGRTVGRTTQERMAAQERVLQVQERWPQESSGELAIDIISAREKESAVQESREDKSKRLQWLLQQLIRQTLQENNGKLCREIRESVVKELDYQFRMQEEREEARDKMLAQRDEEHYKKMDELLRKKSQGRGRRFGKIKPEEGQEEKDKEPNRKWPRKKQEKNVDSEEAAHRSQEGVEEGEQNRETAEGRETAGKEKKKRRFF